MSSGSSPLGQLDRLVRHRDRARVDHRPGQVFGGREVEVGVDHLALPHPGPLDRDRLLHLHDHLGPLPDLVGRGEDRGAGRRRRPRRGSRCRVRRPARRSTVCPAATSASAPAGTSAIAVLVGLDLLRHADEHGVLCGELIGRDGEASGSRLRLLTAPAPSRTTVCRSGAKNSAATAAISSAGHRIDLGQHLVERAILVVVQNEAGQPVHPAPGLSSESITCPLQLLLPVGQLRRRQPLAGEARVLRRGSPSTAASAVAGWVPM